MSEDQGGSGASLPLQVSTKLLTLLSSDDAFRELFAIDPISALTEAGYSWGEAGNEDNDSKLKACCNVRSLASKEAIKDSWDDILRMLTGKTGQISQITPNLDAGLGGGPRSLK